MEDKEINKTTCRACGEIKTRKQVGKFDKINKKFVDETGKAWNGLKCPQCHTDIQKMLQTERRRKRKCEILKNVSGN